MSVDTYMGAQGAPDDTGAAEVNTDGRTLLLGSDVEVANRLAQELQLLYAPSGVFNTGADWVPYCEGAFWRFVGTHWVPIPREKMLRHIYDYDGMPCLGNKAGVLKIGAGRAESILRVLRVVLSRPDFFAVPAQGINCQSGLIHVERDPDPAAKVAKVRRRDHSPQHRQRHVLPGSWDEKNAPRLLPGGKLLPSSLICKLFEGSMRGDPDGDDKVSLLQEVAGCTALGYAPKLRKPKALVMYGLGAENGKGQVLDVIRGLVPPTARCTVSPSDFGDEKARYALIGKLLNSSDELGTSKAVASDKFKNIVTCEPIDGRSIYIPRTEFRPQAQHIFAGNELPAFIGGMDNGTRRRLILMEFNRTIPENEQVQGIGEQIAEKEADLLLAWAVEGACRLVQRGNYPDPAWSRAALAEWATSVDPVHGWIEDRVILDASARVSNKEAFADFRAWHLEDNGGVQSRLGQRVFTSHVLGALKRQGVTKYNAGGTRGIEGIRLRSRSATAAGIVSLDEAKAEAIRRRAAAG